MTEAKPTNAQLYVEKATIASLDVNKVDVYLEGIDESQFVAEIGAIKLLEAMDFSDVHDFVACKLRERDEDDEG